MKLSVLQMNLGTLIGLSSKDDLHSISLKVKNKHLTGMGREKKTIEQKL